MKRFVRSAARQDIQRQFRYYVIDPNAPDVALRFQDSVEEAVRVIGRNPGIAHAGTAEGQALTAHTEC